MWWEDFCDNAEVAATGEDITDAVEVLEPGLKSEHVWPIHGGLFELITPCFAFDITEQADCGLKRKKSIYLVSWNIISKKICSWKRTHLFEF